jgi:hypothetical protein
MIHVAISHLEGQFWRITIYLERELKEMNQTYFILKQHNND